MIGEIKLMKTNTSPVALLGNTARWSAAVRALESQHENPLFIDPWAADLAGPQGMHWVQQRSPDKVIAMVLRTRFYDDFLHKITRQEQIKQVVLLAAGLDTRAFRLNWPENTRFYELDQATVLDHKEQVLSAAAVTPACHRSVIRVDLTTDWEKPLCATGYDTSLPSLWLLEGFLFYLPYPVIVQLLDQVTALATSGSCLGFDIVNSLVLTSPWTKPWVDMQAEAGAPWLGTMDDPLSFLEARGWVATLTQPGAGDANYARWDLPVYPPDMPNMPHHWLVTARRS